MKKYLLIDDNDFSLQLADQILGEASEDKDINIVLAKDGQEAVNIFEASQPEEFDAIFMDIVMPEKTGVIILEEMRSMNRSDAKTVPIVIVSALSENNAFPDSQKRALITDYIQKPLSVDKFKTTLDKISSLSECCH